jgi:hypothetical protein
MGIFDFKKRFGRSINIEEVKKDFVNKINHYLFQEIENYMGLYYIGNNKIFDFLCLSLNKEPNEVLVDYHKNFLIIDEYRIPPLKYFTKNDFEQTLCVIEILYEYFKTSDDFRKDEYLKLIDDVVSKALNQPLSLGIFCHDGKFYPAGAKELSERLIYEPLEWLKDYPKVELLFKNALDHYSKSLQDPIKRKDVISNSFQAIEELTRILLNNNKAFDNNFNDLIKKLELNPHWSHILNRYKELSKEFGRHPGREEFIPPQSDTEAFLYLSGLIMRLILEKLKNT